MIPRKLSELQGTDPIIVVLSRGGFCPKDRRQHEELRMLHRKMEVGYCRMVTITTDTLLDCREFRSGVGAHLPFLSDARRVIQKDSDIQEYTDPVHDPMVPHTVVLEPGLVVYKVYEGYWYFARPTIEELRLDLRATLKRCRPDFSLASPGMRAAWERGEKESFYPYGKSFVEVLEGIVAVSGRGPGHRPAPEPDPGQRLVIEGPPVDCRGPVEQQLGLLVLPSRLAEHRQVVERRRRSGSPVHVVAEGLVGGVELSLLAAGRSPAG